MRRICIIILLFSLVSSCKKETTSVEPQNESDVLITGDSLHVQFTHFSFVKYDVSSTDALKIVGTGNNDSIFIDIYNILLITDSMQVNLDDTRSMKIETRLSDLYNYVSNRNSNPLGISGHLIITSYEQSSLIEAEFSSNSRLTLLNWTNPSNPLLGSVTIQGNIKANRTN